LEDFHNEVVSFDSLPKFESVAFTPLHRDYLNVIYIINSIIAIVFSIAVGLFLFFIDDSRIFLFPMIGVLILFIGLLFWLGTLGFRKKGYALREKDILYKKGIIATTTTIIPFNRIQHVALHEGVLDRMYDLSELQIYTAGGSSSDLSIVGLPKELAERIKTFLLNKILIENKLGNSVESDAFYKNEPAESVLKLDSEPEKEEDEI
jgi:uncharacterized protein